MYPNYHILIINYEMLYMRNLNHKKILLPISLLVVLTLFMGILIYSSNKPKEMIIPSESSSNVSTNNEFDNKIEENSDEVTKDMPIVNESKGPSISVSTPIPTPEILITNTNELVSPLSTDCTGSVVTRGYIGEHHKGMDFTRNGGCWINSAGDGKVVNAGWGSGGEGFQVTIDHGNGLETRYHHGNGEFKVATGDTVLKGELIMYMGCSGNCSGEHLHFEMMINGVLVNPKEYISNLN